MSWTIEEMSLEIINYFKSGDSINLGIGIPTTIAELIPSNLDVNIHSENGVLGVSGRPSIKNVSPTLINAGKETISIKKGASFFDSALSFGMIRGGHIDFCVLGGMEVDLEGSLANWMVPGKKITGMGGAMDLVNGAKKVIIMMKHFNKKNESKLVKLCSLPLTGVSVVDLIVTDLGVFSPNQSKGQFSIIKLAPKVEKNQLASDPGLFS